MFYEILSSGGIKTRDLLSVIIIERLEKLNQNDYLFVILLAKKEKAYYNGTRGKEALSVPASSGRRDNTNLSEEDISWQHPD